MTTIDIIILVIVGAGTVVGFMKGFLRQLAGLLGLIVGLLAAKALYATVAERVFLSITDSLTLAQGIAFVTIWLAVPVGFLLLAMLLTKAMEAVALGWVNRLLGALLGAFLLARIAEMKYFRVNIVACIFSLLILAFVKNDMVNLICIGAVGFFASSVFSIIYSMALQARPEKANQISGLMITAVAGGGVVTPVIGFAIGTVGVIGGVFVTLACVCYLTYCAFGVKTAKA